MASIIVPAHNEAMVIGRTLEALADGRLRPGVHVVVACNGCTDDTMGIAQSFSERLRITVLDLPVRSKQAALNGAEAHLASIGEAQDFPRVFLDADIAAESVSINAVLEVLESGEVLAARPPLEYRTGLAEAPVKAYYDARSRTPEVLGALWGAGIYAVSEQGRRRWREFPAEAPDDLYVDSLFTDDEKRVVDCPPVPVEVPRTTAALFKTLKRVYRPSAHVQEQGEQTAASSGNTLKALLVANSHSPRHAVDALCYVGLAVAARVANKASRGGKGHSGDDWERDETSR